MCTAASSGASAFQVLPAGSRWPTSPGIRGLSSQTRTSATQRSAAGRRTQASNWSVGSHTGLPFVSATVVSSPAADAVSTSSATVVSSRCRAVDVVLRSRTPRPPLRSADGGAAPQRSSSSSILRTASNAAPAAVRSTRACSRAPVARVGTASTGSTVVRPPRRATPTSPGTCAVVPRGTSRRRARSSSAGDAASAGVTVTRAEPGSASPPASTTWSSIARAGSDSSETAAVTDARSGGGSENGRRPLTPCSGPPVRPSATPVRARSPPDDSHARASSSSRSTAAATTSGSAFTRLLQPGHAGAAGEHEGVEDGELGAGELVERAQDRGPGGRPRGQLGGVVRGRHGQVGTLGQQPGQPLVRPAAQLVGERPEPGRSHPANASALAVTALMAIRAPVRRRDRRRPRARGQRGRARRRATALRGRGRHGRARGR